MRDTCSEGREVLSLTVEELERVFSESTNYELIDKAILSLRGHSEDFLKNALKKIK